MRHVLWIGGPPGAGKTTAATRLARRHGLRWYNADTRTWEHRDRAIRRGVAAAIRWEGLAPAERWTASPAELLEMWLHRERGGMVVDDVRRLPRAPLVVAEGSVLSFAGVDDRDRALWLLPTLEAQEAWLDEHRPPPGAREFYRLLGETIERDAHEAGVPVLAVDRKRGIEETVAAVERHFHDALAAGPRAETLAERRALLREGNIAVVGQVRGYCARPWADGDAEEVVRTFLCECGDVRCDADVEATVAVAAAAPVRADGHG